MSGTEPSPRLIARTGGEGAWSDPRFWLQVAVLVVGLIAIYWTDRRNDAAQFASMTAAAANLDKGVAEMKGQVASIQSSVNTLTGASVGMQKDLESVRRDIGSIQTDNKTQDAWLAKIQTDIARLQAQVGR